ncbi:MAG: polya polymerase [Lachnospiraceae bacterium]|nr:polya polymerase [Lachnospiraceae bacterium]
MKLTNVKNVDKLFATIDKCEGQVELVSKEGDRINLKSQLCKFIAISQIFGNDKLVDELELVCYNPDDVKLLMGFMMDDANY